MVAIFCYVHDQVVLSRYGVEVHLIPAAPAVVSDAPSIPALVVLEPDLDAPADEFSPTSI
jgi:hypothetical protein